MGKKINQDEFLRRVKKETGDEYSFLETYNGMNNPIMCQHNVCNYNWKIRPHNFLTLKQRCPQCYLKSKKKTQEEWIRDTKNQSDFQQYLFLEDYVDTRTPIRCKHLVCNNIYKVSPSKFLLGERRPYCKGKRISAKLVKSQKDFEKQVLELTDEYVFLEKYINAKTPIKCLHLKCHNTYMVTPNNFLRGRRCPFCRSSKGEKAIEKVLKNSMIKYEREKAFDWLKNRKYDFFLPEFNLIIEFNGIQHYEDLSNIGWTSLVRQQEIDKLKEKKALQEGYNYLIIPYWKIDNIEEEINNKIKEEYYNGSGYF